LIDKMRRTVLLFAAALPLVLSWPRPAGGILADSPAPVVPASAPAQPNSAPDPVVKGHLAPRSYVNLGFTSPGLLDEIFVAEGDNVKAGETLARLGNLEQYQSRIASGELELLQAQQALDDLNENAAVDLALAEKKLAEARKVQDSASWKVKRMKKPVPQAEIDQAYANIQVSEYQVTKAKDDLRKAQKQWSEKDSLIWFFVKRHDYKLLIIQLEKKVSQAERNYNDAVEKYNDLTEPVDEIDLAQAEADLAVANAMVGQAERDRASLANGPDPDQVRLAQGRIQAAESALTAARAAVANNQLVTPIAGQVVVNDLKTSEWVRPGQIVLVVADLVKWRLEIGDLSETQVQDFQVGQKVEVNFDALPGVKLGGQVESIDLLYGEKHGDVVYTAKISLGGSDPRLRWGMTGEVVPVKP
jgi:HlyD family secretion protein